MSLVDVERILPIIEDYIEKNHYVTNREGLSGGVAKLVYATGVNHRNIFDMRSGRRAAIDTFTLDKILSGLDLTHLAHWPAEMGGFADVFVNLPEKSTRGPYKKKYKAKARVECECGGTKHHAATRCGECHRKYLEAKVRRCVDCDKRLEGGAKRNDTPRCWDCWSVYRRNMKLSSGAEKWNKKFSIRRIGYGE